MDEVRSDENGEFYLEGTAKEITNIDPEIKFYHDCHDVSRTGIKNKPCQRKWKIIASFTQYRLLTAQAAEYRVK